MFEAISYAGLTAPVDYADYIDMIRRELGVTQGFAKEIQVGVATGGTIIYAYEIGNPSPVAPTVFLVAGQHSVEPVGQLAAIAQMRDLVRSRDSRLRRLAASFKVVLIPNANPASFKAAGGGRLNPNGVNLNRNWPFFWSAYTPLAGEEVTNAKGATAASELETQRIMTFMNTYANPVLLIDHHNMGAAPSAAERNTIQVGSASPWVRSNRTVVDAAIAASSAATGGRVVFFGVDFNGEPLLINWASFWMTQVKGVRHASTAIIESYSDLAGGSERVLTDAGATYYCNVITSLMRAQLEQGLRADPARGYTTFAHRATPQDAVSITQGGTLLDVTAATPIQFDNVHAINLAGTRRAFRDVPAPAPGLMSVLAWGYLESSGPTEQRVDAALVYNGVQANAFVTSFTLPATAGLRQGFCFPGLFQVNAMPDAATLQRFALNIWKSGSSTGTTPKILRAGIAITFIPNDGTAPIPIVPALLA